MPGDALTIADLVERTGVPAATIHYYLRHGLVPPPARISGNRFRYDERHERALRLVRALRERRRLSLEMIGRVVPELLRLETEDAFLPDMWDRAIGPRAGGRRTPAARLLAVAKEAFARRGFTDANVDDICRRANVAKGSFYRHFTSKEELFFAVARSAANDAVDAAGGGEHGTARLETLGASAPIFLDLLSGAAQGRPGHRAVAAEVLDTLSRGPGDRERAVELLARAIAGTVDDARSWPASGRPPGPAAPAWSPGQPRSPSAPAERPIDSHAGA